MHTHNGYLHGDRGGDEAVAVREAGDARDADVGAERKSVPRSAAFAEKNETEAKAKN